MKKYLALIFCSLVLITQHSYAASDAEASKAADAFLNAVKIFDIPEGQKAIREASWGTIKKFPVIQDQKTLFEGPFDTDTPGVYGFKRLLELKVQNQAGTTLVKRYLQILYQNRRTEAWKTFELREAGNDLDVEILGSKSDLADTKNVKAQFNYRRYAYWLAMGGKIAESKKAQITANEINKKQPAANFSEAESDAAIATMALIIGDL